MLNLVPSALLEHVCSFLDASALGCLELASNRETCNLIQRSPSWPTLVAKRFGLTDLPKFAVGDDCKPALVRWKVVFASAQQDAKALKAVALEADALAACNNLSPTEPFKLRPREAHIRREIQLMQALRKFPTSDAILSVYARELVKSDWKSRISKASASKNSRGLSGLIAPPVAPASPRYALPFVASSRRGC